MRIKYIVILVLLCIVGFISFRFYKSHKSTFEIRRTLNSEHYQARLSSFNDNLIDTSSIVFIGNSLTQGFDLSKFNNPHVVNRGISGDFTSGLLARLNSVVQRHPKKIFIEIGINDLIEKVPQQTMLSNYDSILERVSTISPVTKIYVHSLLPTRLEGSLLTSNADINTRVVQFNSMLRELTQKYHCTYIDTWRLFVESGDSSDYRMIALYTTDGIHLTDDGYALWIGEIKSLVN